MRSFVARHEGTIAAVARFFSLSALTVPLWYLPTVMEFPFVVPKMLFFELCVTLGGGLYGILLLYRFGAYRPPRSVLTWALGAFVAWVFVSAMFGVDVLHSLWFNTERTTGAVALGFFFVWYLMLLGLMRSRRDWARVGMVAAVVSALVVVLALLQKLFPAFLTGGIPIDRIAGTLGNPIYLAYCAVFAFFLFALLWLWRSPAAVRPRPGWVYAACAVIALFVAALTKTQGAAVGFAVTTVAALSVVAVWGQRASLKRGALYALLMITAVAGLLILGNRVEPFSKLKLVENAGQFSLVGNTAESRLRAWSIAFDAWKDRPVFGWGWANFGLAYDFWYRPEQIKLGLSETWFDSSHNIFLDTLTTTGLPGLLLYLVIYAAAFALLLRSVKGGGLSRGAALVLSGVLLFHALQGLFVFDHISAYVLWFLALAYISAHTTAYGFPGLLMRRAQREHLVSPESAGSAMAALAVVSAAALLFVVVLPARALILQTAASTALQRFGDLGRWYVLSQRAVALPQPYREDVRRGIGSDLLTVELEEPMRTRDVDFIFEFALEQARENARLHGANVRRHLELGELLMHRYIYFKAEHPEIPATADRAYLEGIKRSPRRQQAMMLRASAMIEAENFQSAREVLFQARALSPGAWFVHRAIGPFFEAAGLYEDAISSYEAALRLVDRDAYRDRIMLAPEVVFKNVSEWEAYGLLHIEYGNTQRGAWFLEEVVACATRRVSWRACERESAVFFEPYRPSRKTFGALVLYYEKKGDAARSDMFRSIALDLYQDFDVDEGEAA